MITTNRRKSGGGRIKEGVRGGRERREPYDVCDKVKERKAFLQDQLEVRERTQSWKNCVMVVMSVTVVTA